MAIHVAGAASSSQRQWGFQEIVDVASGRVLWKNEEITDGSYHVLFRPDGKQLALTHWYRASELVNIRDGAVVALEGSSSGKRLAFSADGRIVAVAGDDVKLFATDSGKRLTTVATSSPLRTIALSRDGRKLLVATEDSIVRLLDVRGEVTEEILRIPFASLPADVAFDADDRHIITVSGGHISKHLWRRDDLLAAGCAATERQLTAAELPERLDVERPECHAR